MSTQPIPATVPTILPGAPLPTGTAAPPTDPLDQAGALAWAKVIAQNMAYQINQNAALAYQKYTFPGWLQTYLNSGDWTMTPPNPPSEVMVVIDLTAAEPISSINFLPIGPPVCAIPAYSKIQPPPAPGTLGIGVHLAGNYWSELPTDTMPAGYTTPSPVTTQDGVTGLFQKIAGFANVGAWYLKIG